MHSVVYDDPRTVWAGSSNTRTVHVLTYMHMSCVYPVDTYELRARAGDTYMRPHTIYRSKQTNVRVLLTISLITVARLGRIGSEHVKSC